MKHPARRALRPVLCAALLVALLPPEAVRAAAVAIEAGAVRAPVSIAAGAAVSAGASAVPALYAPALASTPALSASAVVSAASTPLAAPAAASAAASGSAPASAPAAAAASANAPAAAPVDGAPREDALPAEMPAPAASPAPVAAPAPAVAPQPAAVVARGGAWFARAKALFARGAAPVAPESAAAAKSAADAAFDGASAAPDAEFAVKAPQGPLGRLRVRARDWALAKKERFKAKRGVAHDDFGGPKRAPFTRRGKAAYGLRWGLNLIGLSALVAVVIEPLFKLLKWPLHVSPDQLHAFGRVELLTSFGPNEIAEALASSPLSFLALRIPLATGIEELTYRFLDFGLVFGALAAAKQVTSLVAGLLEKEPDATGLRSMVQRALRVVGGFLSYFAFPIAALQSSYAFAAAHFEHWGISPAVFAVNLVGGYVLARVAYKTRGLFAPFIAHLTFNLAILGGVLLLVAFEMPRASMVYGLVAAVVGLISLWRTFRAGRSERLLRYVRRGAWSLLVLGLLNPFSPLPHGVTTTAPFDSIPEHDPDLSAMHAAAAAPSAAPAAAPAPAPAVPDAADMIARVKPAVVQIVVRSEGGYALGSGVIVATDGRIVTNAHVVGDRRPGQEVLVQLNDGRKLPGRILAVNHDRDLAFVQLPTLEKGAWPTAPFAARALREGDPVYGMGHPRGLPFTVSHGIVSGLDARGNMYVQYLQTDASINPGNSGGPLFNAYGEIVGINTMIYTESGGSEGIGFSIVAPSVVAALAQYDQSGNINTAALGIVVDLSTPLQPPLGVAVEFVRPGSGADQAGIRPGDVILDLNGESITRDGTAGAEQLSSALAKARPGARVEILVMRGDAVMTLAASLGAKWTSEETSTAHRFEKPAP